MLRTNILLLFFVTSAGDLIYENVFIYRMADFSMSRSKWLVSFVIDLSTYERFLDRLTRGINKVAIMTYKVLNATGTPGHSILRNDYKIVLDGMRRDISVVKGVYADILESFGDYRLLKETDRQSRRKGKIFSFIRDIIGELFRVMTHDDINSI